MFFLRCHSHSFDAKLQAKFWSPGTITKKLASSGAATGRAGREGSVTRRTITRKHSHANLGAAASGELKSTSKVWGQGASCVPAHWRTPDAGWKAQTKSRL